MVLVLVWEKSVLLWKEILEETGRHGTQDTGSSVVFYLCSKTPWKMHGTTLLWTAVDFIETKFNIVISIFIHYSYVSCNVWKLRKLGPLCCWQNGIMKHSHFPVPIHDCNEVKRAPGCWGKTTFEKQLYMYSYTLPLLRANVPLSNLGWSSSIK